MNLTRLKKIVFVGLLLFLCGFLGYNLGKREVSVSWQNFQPKIAIENKEPPSSLGVTDFSLFWDVWDRTLRSYYDKTVIDSDKLLYGAISGMLQSLGDPYTVFLTPQQNKETKQELSGEFEGIGAQLGLRDKKIVVIAPLKDTPAESAGIKAGDTIVKIDEKDTSGLTLPEAVQRIRGRKGTAVTLTVLHEGDEETVDISIVRDTIKVQSVEGGIKNVKCQMSPAKRDPAQRENVKCQIVEKGEACDDCSTIGYIRLSQFGDNTSSEWLKVVGEVASRSKESNFKGVVLDLRNNPGGYLNGSVFIASEFIASGTVVIQEKGNGQNQAFSVDRRGILTDVPLVVLINKGSASASEIVAGALRDRKGIKLVGEKSFGKGTVQEAQDLPSNAGLHITTARWLTPKGTWVNDKGLIPDIEIEINKEDPKHDTQLEKAIEALVQ